MAGEEHLISDSADAGKPSRTRRWLNRATLLIFLLYASFFAAVYKYDVDHYQVHRHDSLRRNKLKVIGLALHNYREKHGRFPHAAAPDSPNGPIQSWRTKILPYLVDSEELAKSYRFDEPWNGPRNLELLPEIDDGRIHSAVYSREARPTADRSRTTAHFLAVVGPRTMWEQGAEFRGFQSMRELSMILVAIEVPDSDIAWTEPRDLDADEAIRRLSEPRSTS